MYYRSSSQPDGCVWFCSGQWSSAPQVTFEAWAFCSCLHSRGNSHPKSPAMSLFFECHSMSQWTVRQVRRLVQASRKSKGSISFEPLASAHVNPAGNKDHKKLICPWRKYLVGLVFDELNACQQQFMRLEIVDDDVRQHQRFGNAVAINATEELCGI